MNRLEFVAHVLSTLAWPSVVVTAVLIFKSEVRSLLRRLKSAELPGGAFVFGDELEAVERQLEAVERSSESALIVGGELSHGDQAPEEEAGAKAVEPSDILLYTTVNELTGLAMVADRNPSYAVLTAWERGDNALRQFEREIDVLMGVEGPPSTVLHMRHFSMDIAASVRQLRNLRNAAAHGQADPTAGEAVAFVESVERAVTAAYAQLEAFRSSRP